MNPDFITTSLIDILADPIKLGDLAGGQKSEYIFHKLYLSPFDDRQVEAFLRKRYPLLQRKKRRQANEMVAKIPSL
ncbi:MAG: hypothetical protein ACE5I1_17215, partial [bacterium]